MVPVASITLTVRTPAAVRRRRRRRPPLPGACSLPTGRAPDEGQACRPWPPRRHGHTHRLDLDDATVREWDATVLAADPEQGIVLDRSAFYPGGGGQPPDEGVLLWGGVRTRIAGTRKGDELYLIPVEGDPVPPPGTAVRGALDDERRTELMRTHSGLHVLTGVVFRDFGALVTGGNMEPLTARMDFDLAEVPADFKERVAESVNAEIAADRPIEVKMLPPRRGVRDPRHHPDGDQPAAAGHRGGADRRHRRPRHPGRRRHARGVDGDGRPRRGREDGEQGTGFRRLRIRIV